MARVRDLDPAHRHRTIFRDYLGGAPDGTDRPRAHRRICRHGRRLPERNRLRASLRRRLRTVLCSVVHRNDRLVHLCRLEAGVEAAALVAITTKTYTTACEAPGVPE